jgi:Tat protein secretion system quality control protein TatD with DNase activity
VDAAVHLHQMLRVNNLPVSRNTLAAFCIHNMMDTRTKPHKESNRCEAIINIVDHPESFNAAITLETYGGRSYKLRSESDKIGEEVKLPKIYTAWGIHPLSAHLYSQRIHEDLRQLMSRKPAEDFDPEDRYQVWLRNRHVNLTIATTCGLDYHDKFHRNQYVGGSSNEYLQKSVMREILDLSKEIFGESKTIQLHVHGKKAAMDALSILQTYYGNKNDNLRIVIMPFTEDMEVAQAYLDAYPQTKFGVCGLHVSGRDVAAQSIKTVIGVTDKPGGLERLEEDVAAELARLRGLVSSLGLDKIVLGSNSPGMFVFYSLTIFAMAPDPFRSTSNHPGLVPFIITELAKTLKCPEDELYTAALANTTTVYAL